MAEYIDREAFIAAKRAQYCDNCDRRKGMKNGKMRFVYEIGDAPCRACGVGDMMDDIEDYPAADVVEVKRGKWEEVEVTEYETAQLMVASMRCPVCNRYHNEVYHYGNPTEMAHYCGICGAKMDESEGTMDRNCKDCENAKTAGKGFGGKVFCRRYLLRMTPDMADSCKYYEPKPTPPTPSPQTNADRIRAMTDEELAMCLKDLTCPFRYGGKVICDIDNKGCHQCWLDWLKQEI